MDVKVFSILLVSTVLWACSGKVDSYSASDSTMDQDPPDGQLLYLNNCASCHGVDGKAGVTGAKDLGATKLDTATIYRILVEGKNLMPPLGYIITSEDERNAVVEHVISLRE